MSVWIRGEHWQAALAVACCTLHLPLVSGNSSISIACCSDSSSSPIPLHQFRHPCFRFIFFQSSRRSRWQRKKLEEAKKDPKKGEIMSKKHSWKAAVSRAAGVKIHDDPKLLKQSIKKGIFTAEEPLVGAFTESKDLHCGRASRGRSGEKEGEVFPECSDQWLDWFGGFEEWFCIGVGFGAGVVL